MRRETTYALPNAPVAKTWRVINAEGQSLGRLASEVATILMGKHKPQYTPFVDSGDPVIVINGKKIELTGNKATTKLKLRYSYYPGGQKAETYGAVRDSKPDKLIGDAVRRMLPKNRLSRMMMKNLYVFAGADHPHADKNPVEIKM